MTSSSVWRIPGRTASRANRGASATVAGRSPSYMIVGADYFKALGLTMLRGREFTIAEEESADAPRVAIINEPLARQLFPNEDPIGQMIRITRHEDEPAGVDFEPMQVVGVALGLRQTLFDQAPTPPRRSALTSRSGMHLHVRVAPFGPPGRSGRARSTANRAQERRRSSAGPGADGDAGLPRPEPRPLGSPMGGRLLTTFGALALILAVVGVLRREILRRLAADERNRHTNGAGSAPDERPVARATRRCVADGGRRGCRLAPGRARRKRAERPAVSGQSADPVVYAIAPAAGGRSSRSLLSTGTPRVHHAADGTEDGVAQPS